MTALIESYSKPTGMAVADRRKQGYFDFWDLWAVANAPSRHTPDVFINVFRQKLKQIEVPFLDMTLNQAAEADPYDDDVWMHPEAAKLFMVWLFGRKTGHRLVEKAGTIVVNGKTYDADARGFMLLQELIPGLPHYNNLDSARATRRLAYPQKRLLVVRKSNAYRRFAEVTDVESEIVELVSDECRFKSIQIQDDLRTPISASLSGFWRSNFMKEAAHEHWIAGKSLNFESSPGRMSMSLGDVWVGELLVEYLSDKYQTDSEFVTSP